MKLYYSRGASSLAPHILLCCAGLPFELVRANIQSGKLENGSDYVNLNPKGYVPALLLDDGELLSECAVILQFIADQVPGMQLMPAPGTRERYRAQMLLNFIATELHKGFSHLFNPAMPEEAKTIARNKLSDRFLLMETQLHGKAFLQSDNFTAPDAYLFTVLRWSEHCKMDLQHWPELAAYRERVFELPYVQEALRAEGLLKQ